MTIEERKGLSAKKWQCSRGGDWVSGAEGIYRVEESISQYAARPEPWIQVPQYSRIDDGKAAGESALSEKSKLKSRRPPRQAHDILADRGSRQKEVAFSFSPSAVCVRW